MKKLLSLFALTAVLAAGPSFNVFAADAPAPAAPAAPKPEPTLEQRLATVEAYINNTDPSAPLKAKTKDKDGKEVEAVPEGLATPTSATAGPGHNGFMMICAALVLFMTLPGLFLFYGGLVRKKNILSVIAQCFGIAGLVTILWVVCGYSLVFADGTGPFIGDFKFAMLKDVDALPNTNYAYWISENVFSMYQLMFAIITPALILGAIAERMKFSAVLLFVGLWMFVVYFPLAHMVWGINGFMNGVWNPDAGIKAIDFAGGTVVHMSSGWSALVLCIILGKRIGFGKEPMQPHSMVMCSIGTGMLWVGWYGFNAGSALAADGIAAGAFTATTIAAAVGSFVWPMLEWVVRGKPSILGFCSGAVAGLVVITPAAGFVTPGAALVIGVLAGVVPFFACTTLKKMFGYDDALDTFGVHAVGGTLGALVTGMFARNSANANLGMNLKTQVTDSLFQPLLMEQVKAVVITIILSVVATAVIAYIVKAVIGLRPADDVERQGLDVAEHGEEGYHG